MLIIRPNTTIEVSKIVFYYTLQRVSAVQISHHQGDVRYIKMNVKGEAPLFTVVRIITILFQKDGNIRLKGMHNYVTEFLRYNQCQTVI
jgi:hypothetical protein